MGKGIYINKGAAIGGVFVAAAALSTIIALSVVYSQERSKTNGSNDAGTTGPTNAPPTQAPSNEPWDKYRLPTNLVPDNYHVMLWPRLKPDPESGLYIFTGKKLGEKPAQNLDPLSATSERSFRFKSEHVKPDRS